MHFAVVHWMPGSGMEQHHCMLGTSPKDGSAAWMTSGHPGCDAATHKQCPEHDGRPGCRRARFGSAAASSDGFKLLQDNIGTDKSFS